jgi:G:T-mismatch repair DNA endonuclease (very short patch repair protein)
MGVVFSFFHSCFVRVHHAEDIETSLSDYQKALSILERLVEPDSRHLAELYPFQGLHTPLSWDGKDYTSPVYLFSGSS